ncbi:7-carboxy-7-deazaguanine synthase QueE [Alkalicoccus urumqiensis]|uniref:7-carboxy-7-deazaguanine synthase n=1 Tax=Alkalicoccus urumqiensis TaxID=1548213 RepID=A0A2P6MEX1_ALKUR|nr:7-carboxy-7-deazaguanine synthase QueE [Alkalicoccus urumqiensis]PRO64814.1 7-carboxy-7-deazaguanine synthase QueE [Alkalicoccus urumqiensis]
MSKSKLPVLEIFGPTFQGEGMVIGQKTMFVRTAGCDYSCSWCDSAFTWDGSAKEDIRMLTPEEVVDELDQCAPDNYQHVTISGGNPALLASVGPLCAILRDRGIKTALETQGSRWQDWFLNIDDLTISPKPPSSLMKPSLSMLDDIVEKLRNGGRLQHTSLKVVVFNEEDFQFAKSIHHRYPDLAFYLQTGNEDTGESQETGRLVEKLLDRYHQLVERTMEDNEMTAVHVLPQLHTLVWGNQRGV